MDALSEEEGSSAGVVELLPVVALDSLDSGAKLSGGVGEEVCERAVSIRLEALRKSPQIVSAIIKYDQIIFVTRDTNNWRCPQIAVYQIKILRCPRRGASERKADMSPKLTSMTEGSVVSLAVADDGGVLGEVM